ncbi:MAG: helix-turn-helix domain-containing protein, partial [Chloroflexota bacterium]
LMAYCHCRYSMTLTAERLFIHRNTLVKRLDRIEQLCGFDLKESMTLLNLYLVLLAEDLHR